MSALDGSSAPPMSCLFGILCQETSVGSHSVANGEKRRSALTAPHSGHGGETWAEAETSSSNRWPQSAHRYS